MTQRKADVPHTTFIAKLHSNESSSRTTNILVDRIDPTQKWKVIGYLETMSLRPSVDSVYSDRNTIVSMDVSSDSIKDTVVEKIVSYIRSLGVDGVSVSQTHEFGKTVDRKSNSLALGSDYDLVSSNDVEQIALRMEAGDQSEFELILASPDEFEKRSRHREQSSRNLISSMQKSHVGSHPGDLSDHQRSLGIQKTVTRNLLKAKNVTTQTKRVSHWVRVSRRLLTFLIQIKSLRCKGVKNFFRTNFKRYKNRKRFRFRMRSQCCSHCGTKDRKRSGSACSWSNKALHSQITRLRTQRQPQANIEHLSVEAYVQTDIMCTSSLLREDKPVTFNEEKRSVHQNISKKNKETKPRTQKSCTTSTVCSCCSTATISESQPLTNVTRIPQVVYPTFHNSYGLNPPMFYVLPPEQFQTILNPTPIRYADRSKDSSCCSDSTNYSSMSSIASNFKEKDSTKEKITIYTKKDQNGQNCKQTCKRSIKSVRLVKIVNTPSLRNKSSKKLFATKSNFPTKEASKRSPQTNITRTCQTNVLTNQPDPRNDIREMRRELQSQLDSMNQINMEKLLFMKQLEHLSEKIDELTSLKNKIPDKLVKTDTNVNTVEVGTLCAQVVDTAVECNRGVDAFSECDGTLFPNEEKESSEVEASSLDDEKELEEGELSEDFVSNDSISGNIIEDGRSLSRSESDHYWDIPFDRKIYFCSQATKHDLPPPYPSWPAASKNEPTVAKQPLRKNSSKKQSKGKSNNCSFLSTIFGKSNHEKQLKKQAKEITEIKKLITHLKKEIDGEPMDTEMEEDSDAEDTIQFSLSRPNHVKKSVTFRTPLVDRRGS